MTEHVYENKTISNIHALEHSLYELDTKAAFSYDGSTVVVDTTESYTNTLIAVDRAVDGSLYSNKEGRIQEIKEKTEQLQFEGFTFTRPSDSATDVGPVNLDHEERHRLRNLKDDVKDGILTLPQAASGVSGHPVALYTSADVDACYQALLDRGAYIAGSQQNADNSYGESGYIYLIESAVTQTALDAIVDTRV